jgi:hypothetical protein
MPLLPMKVPEPLYLTDLKDLIPKLLQELKNYLTRMLNANHSTMQSTIKLNNLLPENNNYQMLMLQDPVSLMTLLLKQELLMT